MKQPFLIFITIVISTLIYAQPPYSGTIFIDPDIVTSLDQSAIQSTSYTGTGMVTMYDRRVPGWVTVNAYLFEITWDDGLTSVAQINPEFGTIAAATTEAEKYGFLIGQLPRCLREDVNEIWIHRGVQPFGGGNNSILIHTGQSILYENDGIIEETLVHEACHTSLDATHAASAGWINAQNQDDEFISTYAESNPTTEDVAESFLPWLAVRFRQANISSSDYNTITQTIPNRLAYFDSIPCDLYPFVPPVNTEELSRTTIKVYPNPMKDRIYIQVENTEINDLKLFNLLGQDITYQTSYTDGILNVAELPNGYYLLKVNNSSAKIYKQF